MTRIYCHPDLDAAVAIERRGQLVLLDFLAKGRSQKRAGGKVVGYATRNADRRALVDHVLAQLAGAGDTPPWPGTVAVGAAGGKGAPYTALDVDATDPAVRRSYSAAGNYRWRLWLRLAPGELCEVYLNDRGEREPFSTDALAWVLGLEPYEAHRPVKTSWPAVLLALVMAVVATVATPAVAQAEQAPRASAAQVAPARSGLTIGSLFAGVGGIEAGLEWAGHGPTIWQVEKNETRRQILAKHWPRAQRFERVEHVGAAQLRRPSIVTAGFPCGDTSVAGKGAGMDGTRSGLWAEAVRILDELGCPDWVVVENVANGARRWVDRVRGDLGQLGYASIPVELQARYAGLPHRRARVFLLAHSEREALRVVEQRLSRRRAQDVRDRPQGELVDARRPGRWETLGALHRADDGLSRGLDKDRIAGCGVAVVPQLAQIVGEMINLMRGA